MSVFVVLGIDPEAPPTRDKHIPLSYIPRSQQDASQMRVGLQQVESTVEVGGAEQIVQGRQERTWGLVFMNGLQIQARMSCEKQDTCLLTLTDYLTLCKGASKFSVHTWRSLPVEHSRCEGNTNMGLKQAWANCETFYRKIYVGTGEKSWWLRALATLPKDLYLIVSTYMVTHNPLLHQWQGIQYLFLDTQDTVHT